ncbi:MAG: hypothetical protein QHC90_25330 [Shinella sp.]|nr:hypothetical protein [Shinella sp.]
MSTIQLPNTDKPTQTVLLVGADGEPVEIGGGGGTSQVQVTNFPATQPVSGTVTATGPLTNAQQTAITGTSATAAYADSTGAAAGTVIALLKGLYVQQAQMITLLNDIKTNTTPAP